MVTFVGFLNGPPDPLPLDEQFNRRTDEGIDGSTPYRLMTIDDPLDPGELTREMFMPMFREYGGYLSYSYFDDYYNRVWMLPTTVDFGSITSTTSVTVFLWNAHLHPVTLTAIGQPDPVDPSVYATGLDVPLTLPALGGINYSVWADINGEPSISTSLNFTFTPTEQVSLPIVGVRARLWPFAIDWSNGFEVTYEYLTEIITSEDGSEQRIAERQTPRKSFSFNSVVNGASYKEFIRQMAAWAGRTTIVPEFSKFVHLKFAVTPGDNFITADPVPAWVQVGTVMVLIKDEQRLLKTVDSIVGNVIAFTSTIAGDWPVDWKAFKGVSGHLASEISTTQHTNRANTISVQFNADPGIENVPIPPGASTTWNGREVFMKRPNWTTAPTPSFVSYLQTVDYGHGRSDYFLPVTYVTKMQNAAYLDRSIAETEESEQLFQRLLGQQGEFYMPTYTDDIELGYDVVSTTSNMRIKGPEFAIDYRNDVTYKDLIIFLEGGGYLMKRVQQIYEIDDSTGNDSIIQVIGAFTDNIAISSIRQICWMPLWRMASDQLTLSYVTDEVATFQLAIRSLEYEAPE